MSDVAIRTVVASTAACLLTSAIAGTCSHGFSNMVCDNYIKQKCFIMMTVPLTNMQIMHFHITIANSH